MPPASPTRARFAERGPPGSHEPDDRDHDLRARRVRRLRGDLEGADDPAHAADVADQRDPRHRHARWPDRPRLRERRARVHDRHDRGRLRDDQDRRRLHGHRPDARHVLQKAEAEGRRRRQGRRKVIPAVLEPGGDGATALYIVAFSLFIIGVKRGTHPTTAKQGNLVAAAGMAVAVVTTLLLDGVGNWGLVFLGLGIGTAVGVVASVRVQMTEMPQMVALYNGVGGGAVALIAWAEIRHGISLGEAIPLDELIPILFAAVVGSVSFWGSNIAFAKLQDLIPTRPLAVPGQQVVNGLLLVGILAACISIVVNNDD